MTNVTKVFVGSSSSTEETATSSNWVAASVVSLAGPTATLAADKHKVKDEYKDKDKERVRDKYKDKNECKDKDEYKDKDQCKDKDKDRLALAAPRKLGGCYVSWGP